MKTLNIPNHSASSVLMRNNEKLTRKIIRELNPRKPLGPCTVPAWAIKDGQEILIPHITFIINECIKNNIFPNQFKLANVTPLYKKDDPLDVTNYRPISITSGFSKILEKILHKQITEYLERNNLMNPLQFGFRKKYSTQDALLYFTESIRKELDSKKIVHAALLHLSMAFASISHDELNQKFSTLGVDEKAKNCFQLD